MKNKNKPDNLESFFQRVLKDYEEEPDVSFWNNIAPNIPAKSIGPNTSGYRGWMVLVAFVSGLLFSTIGFFLQSNTTLINTLKEEITIKDTYVNELKIEIERLKKANKRVGTVSTINNQNQAQEITQRIDLQEREISLGSQKSDLVSSTNKNSLIKLEMAHNKGAVAATQSTLGSKLQSSFSKETVFIEKDLSYYFQPTKVIDKKQLFFDNQLITNSFFAKKVGVLYTENEDEAQSGLHSKEDLDYLNLLKPALISDKNRTEEIDQEKIDNLLKLTKKKTNFSLGKDGLISFLTFSMNPISGLKYNLDGYQPNPNAIVESAGITSSWNWSVYGGFETKSKWSVQMGVDYNKLTIVKESVNNIRFKSDESQKINEGYVYSFNRRSDGALGSVSVSTTVFNQIKNDNQDITNGDLFKLSVSTEQPVQIIRVPILGGYRFDLSSRFYLTPKIGFSSVWKTKDRTQLRSVNTFDDRLSVQNTGIFLTSKVTTESLEANLRTEFGFRWRPRWYLVAEPRFKYAGKSLFSYKDLELRDAPFHLPCQNGELIFHSLLSNDKE